MPLIYFRPAAACRRQGEWQSTGAAVASRAGGRSRGGGGGGGGG